MSKNNKIEEKLAGIPVPKDITPGIPGFDRKLIDALDNLLDYLSFGIGGVSVRTALQVESTLSVNNDIKAKGTISGLKVDATDIFARGNVSASDMILVPGRDCAENFNVGAEEVVEPGTVMVVGDRGLLVPCDREYDKRAAGIISGAGSYKPGIILGNTKRKDFHAPIALMGRVYCKVDSAYSSVEVGDLLTTSSTLGYAMKAGDPSRAFGAVIGKALDDQRSGKGLVPVLVSLQ
jgi:hypothetical protein